MTKPSKFLLTFLVLCLPIQFALAGEGPFSRALTTETVEKGAIEFEQLVRNRRQRAFGEYNTWDLRTEFEYGVSDSVQAGLYLSTAYLHASGAPDDNDQFGATGFSRDSFYLHAVTAEFAYRAFDPKTSFMGLAFYFEPSLLLADRRNGNRIYDGLENEYRIILQKNFFENRLLVVYNMVLELEYFRYGDRETLFTGELEWNHEIGATYNFAHHWYGGLEVRNENELENLYAHGHSVVWLGPSFYYDQKDWWASFGVLKQVFGEPNGPDDEGSPRGDGYFLHSREMWEMTAKIAFTFPGD